MFCMNPVILALSLSGSLSLFLLRNGKKGALSHLVFLTVFVITALINPIFNHNGVTVLFVVNDNPVTLEALLYGIAAAAMIVSVIYWFRSFSQVMTSDKLLYLFGSASPKLALLLSMTLRYIPLFGLQAKKADNSQKALGLYKEDNAIDYVRGKGRVFSVMVTWALENGIITADSMAARGYGVGRRTFYSLYRFRKSDIAFIIVILTLSALTVAGIISGTLDFDFYPATSDIGLSPLSLTFYISYALLAFLPSLNEITEDIKWKHLRSKI